MMTKLINKSIAGNETSKQASVKTPHKNEVLRRLSLRPTKTMARNTHSFSDTRSLSLPLYGTHSNIPLTHICTHTHTRTTCSITRTLTPTLTLDSKATVRACGGGSVVHSHRRMTARGNKAQSGCELRRDVRAHLHMEKA